MFNRTGGGASDIDIGDNVPFSARFNSADNTFTSITPLAGNLDTWTWSGWVKRSTLGGAAPVLFSAGADNNNQSQVSFQSTDRLQYIHLDAAATTDHVLTTEVYRDISAWYHIVCAVDTTHVTEASRVRIYVNGTEITDLDQTNYPVQNVDTDVGSANPHRIGCDAQVNSSVFNGYMAHVHYVDGSQLTPSSFGRTSADTGEWVPKTYAGTHGTNGFNLDFADSSDYGNDVSGNDNDLTDAAGFAANDQMLDSPTNNYPVFNARRTHSPGTGRAESNGNLVTAGGGATGTWSGVMPTTIEVPHSGKWYCEWKPTKLAVSATGTTGHFWGIINKAQSAYCVYQYRDGNTVNDGRVLDQAGELVGSLTQLTNSQVVSCNIDMDAETVEFKVDDVSVYSGAFTLVAGEEYSFATTLDTGEAGRDATISIDCGQQGFLYTPNTGYLPLCTANLVRPSIIKPNVHFDAVLWTGDDSNPRTFTDLAFMPDLVWFKNRNGTKTHRLFDAVRGVNNNLQSDSTADEVATAVDGYLTAFTAAGFTVDTGATNDTAVNDSTQGTYVAWCWKGDGTSGATNSDGTITSTVNVNDAAGFSFGTYTGTGVAATIGHGQSAVPEMIAVKARVTAGADVNWVVYHKDSNAVPEDFYLPLDLASAAIDSPQFNDTAPTASLFSVGTLGGTNISGDTYVFYAWRSIPGFSKIGSYTGNGVTADGPYVECGFKPAYVLIKDITNTYEWWVFDNKRDIDNTAAAVLRPNGTNAEAAVTQAQGQIDIHSNGFKVYGDTTSTLNDTSDVFIYAAFADIPFKYARAR